MRNKISFHWPWQQPRLSFYNGIILSLASLGIMSSQPTQLDAVVAYPPQETRDLVRSQVSPDHDPDQDPNHNISGVIGQIVQMVTGARTACGEVQEGNGLSWLTFDAQGGVTYTVEGRGDGQVTLWAKDKRTKKRRSTSGVDEVTLKLTSDQDTTYNISILAENHTLEVKCPENGPARENPGEKAAYCVVYEGFTESSDLTDSYHATNVASLDEAGDFLDNVGPHANAGILEGSCKKQSSSCPDASAGQPASRRKAETICADMPEPDTQFDNLCTLKSYIKAEAGDQGESMARFSRGPC